MSEPHRELVERGYDRVAGRYLATKDPQDPLVLSALEEMTADLPPGATFLRADITGLAFGPGAFGAVVAFHSIIHVPREEHSALLGRIHRWLAPGGLFLATLIVTDFEGEDGDWGAGGPDVLEPLRRAEKREDAAPVRLRRPPRRGDLALDPRPQGCARVKIRAATGDPPAIAGLPVPGHQKENPEKGARHER